MDGSGQDCIGTKVGGRGAPSPQPSKIPLGDSPFGILDSPSGVFFKPKMRVFFWQKNGIKMGKI